jgi:hypothetical protein
MAAVWVKKRVLITVRTYPTPAWKGIEVSCTAGVTEARQWIRLFPMPYRYLSSDKRFRKYQWIELNTKKSSDPIRCQHIIIGKSGKRLSYRLNLIVCAVLKQDVT